MSCDDARGWQVGLGLQDCFSQLLDNHSLTDVTLVVHETGGASREFPAHRVILAARSPVFEAMFSGNFRESDGEPVEIRETEIEAFSVMLRYLYTERVTITGDNAIQLLQLARRYIVDGLVELCCDFLKNHVDSDNVSGVLTNSIAHPEQDIVDHSLKVAWSDPEALMKSTSFLDMSQDALCTFLTSYLWVHNLSNPDVDKVDEVCIIEGVVRWAEYQSKQQKISARECLGDCLYHLRYVGLSPSQYASIVGTTEIMTDGERANWLSFLTLRNNDMFRERVSSSGFPTGERGTAVNRGSSAVYDSSARTETFEITANGDIKLLSLGVFDGSSPNDKNISVNFTIADQGNAFTDAATVTVVSSGKSRIHQLLLPKPWELKKDTTYTIKAHAPNGAWLIDSTTTCTYEVGVTVKTVQKKWAARYEQIGHHNYTIFMMRNIIAQLVFTHV